MNMTMENEVRIDWYLKAENVILSAKNIDQLRVGKNYIDFYLKQTNDSSGYEVLVRKFFIRYNELS